MERLTFVESIVPRTRAARELGITPGRFDRLRAGTVKPPPDLNNRIYNMARREGYRQMREFGFSPKMSHDLQGRPEPHVGRARGIYHAARQRNPDLKKVEIAAKIKALTRKITEAVTDKERRDAWDELRRFMYKKTEEEKAEAAEQRRRRRGRGKIGRA